MSIDQTLYIINNLYLIYGSYTKYALELKIDGILIIVIFWL